MAFQNYLDTLQSSARFALGARAPQWIVIEETLAGKAMECLGLIGMPQNVTLVADRNTHEVLGQYIEHEIGGRLTVNTTVFQEAPVPDITHATQVREAAQDSDLIIAIGSGTVSDICKYASFLAQKPYVVFPTAPSMNGYLSATASIVKAGHRYSFPAHLPVGVFCDMDVLAKAPQRLIRSGFGDVMCRTTAQADWLLSHLLLGTPYDSQAFDLLKPLENKLLRKPSAIAEGNRDAVQLLLQALFVSGLGMTLSGGSYPASQGEHLIAHCMEMTLPWDSTVSYHGEQIAVTTLTMAALQDTYMMYVPGALKRKNADADIVDYFGASLREGVLEEYKKKQLPDKQMTELNRNIATQWPELMNKLRSVRIPTDKLRKHLTAAGCPTKPEDIGWKEEDYERAVHHAHFIRDRFTFLDVAYLSR